MVKCGERAIRGLNARLPSRSRRSNSATALEREAHAIAALNHPNICTLYDVGPNYLVMELIEGPTSRAHRTWPDSD